MKAPAEVTRVFGTLLRVRKLQQLIEELIPGFSVEGSDEVLEEESGGDGEKEAPETTTTTTTKNPPPPPSRLLHCAPTNNPPTRPQRAPAPDPTPVFTRPPPGVGRTRSYNAAQGGGQVPKGSPLGLTNSASTGRGRGSGIRRV